MAHAFQTFSRNWILLGCACMIAVCTLASGLCTDFRVAELTCQYKGTCNNGTCIVNLSSTECDITCNCSGGYQGRYCDVSPSETTTTMASHAANNNTEEPAGITTTSCTSATLAADLIRCEQMHRCFPGECSIDTYKCAVKCDCPAGYEGEHCENYLRDISPTVSSVKTTTGQVPRAKKCGHMYMCDHGVCVMGKLPCICSPGWGGPLCDLPCNLTCMNGGICKVNTTTRISWCNCPFSYTGELCAGIANHTGDVPQSKKCGRYVCAHGDCPTGRLPCICYPRWRGPLCDQHCNLACMNGGKCIFYSIPPTLQSCRCPRPYTGDLCELVITTAVNQEVIQMEVVGRLSAGQAAGIGVASVLGVVILAALVVLCYIMCKRKRNSILSLGLRCCTCRQFEDDDCASYDAFVWYKEPAPFERDASMASPDEHMALRRILPKLEGELRYRVCMPFRDFAIDTPLETSILNAVRTSRRIILVMSKGSIKDSIWLQPSYQKVLSTMIGRRKSVIIITIEEVTQSKDSRMNALFKSARIVEWPAIKTPGRIQRFWLQLELAMPKVHHARSADIRPVLATQESCFSTRTETSTISINSPSDVGYDSYSDVIDVDAGIDNDYNADMELTDEPMTISEDSSQRDQTKQDEHRAAEVVY